ncbi:MAG: DUF5615 family PIN-like protein [Rhodoplanes sp.]
MAAAHDHIVLTSDLDFGAILAATRQLRPSVLQVRSDLLTPEAIGGAVLAAIRQAQLAPENALNLVLCL